MLNKDPLHEVEKVFKEAHDTAGKYTQPILKKYPLSFAFAVTFSLAAILKGFDILTMKVQVFVDHPYLLILIGSITLFITGTLYKVLSHK